MTRIWPLPCEGLGNHSYLAEVGSGFALAVDPGRDPRPYLCGPGDWAKVTGQALARG